MVLNLMIIGLAVTLDPLPLSAFLVVLPSKRGVRKGAAFVFGWLVSLAIVVTATVLATGNNPPQPNTAPSLASLAVRIALGAGLVAIAVRDRRRIGQPTKPKKPPKWQAHVDNMSPWFAMVLAPTLQPGAPPGLDASAAPSPAAPAAGTSKARPVGAGAPGRPGTPGRQGRTAAGSYPAAAPAPRSGDTAPRSPRPCPGRSPQAAAVTRTRSSHRDRPVEAAQPIIMPQQADLRTATSSCGLRRNRIATPTWADEVSGTGKAEPGRRTW